MPNQGPKTDVRPFIPRFSAKIVSWRKPLVVFILRHIPAIDLPMLEPWDPDQVFRTVDQRSRKTVLFGGCLLDDMMNIISRLRIRNSPRQFFQSPRWVEIALDGKLEFSELRGPLRGAHLAWRDSDRGRLLATARVTHRA